MQKRALGRVVQFIAVAWLFASNTVAAQSNGSYQLRAPSLQVHAATPNYERHDKPSFVAPLIITAVGFSVGAGAIVIGAFSRMGSGTCSPSPSVPPPGTQPEQPFMDCDRSMPTAAIVTGIAGGAVGVLGAIWLVERLIARGAYNREQRGLSFHLVPTVGGAVMFGRF